MSNYLNYMRQLTAGDPFASLGNSLSAGLSAISDGIDAGLARKRLAEQDRIAAEDRQRKIAAEDRAQKAAQLKGLEELAVRYAAAGQHETAAQLWNQTTDLRKSLFGVAGPQITGSPKWNAYDLETQQPLKEAGYRPEYGPQSSALIKNLAGWQAPKPHAIPGGHTIVNPDGTFGATAPLAVRPLDPLTEELRRAQTSAAHAQAERARRGPVGRGGSARQPKVVDPYSLDVENKIAIRLSAKEKDLRRKHGHRDIMGRTTYDEAAIRQELDAFERKLRKAAGQDVADPAPAPQPYYGAPYAPGVVPPNRGQQPTPKPSPQAAADAILKKYGY